VSRLELKVPPDVVWLIIAALMWPVAAVTRQLAVDVPFRVWIAAFLAACGIALIVAARVMLGRARTTWSPTAPERASRLVETGVYAFSRNPIYLGMLIVLLAWAVVLASPIAWAMCSLFVAYMDRFQIRPEERALSALLGQEYRDYVARVRRWL
jgi:protein-S-isoprenylcysteine O-methyltransferase Ste14